MITALVIILLVAAFILYLIKPNKKRFRSFPAPLFAHRGLHGNGVPENSLTAFIKARQRGLGVELDVRFTLDKRLVVFHDDGLKRLCGEELLVNALSYEDLKRYRLSGTDETIPLFTDVLKALEEIPVICEIKSIPGEAVDGLCESVCREIEGYKGFMCIESFNPYVVQWFAKNRPDIIRGQLSMNFMKSRDSLPFVQAFAMTHLLVNALARPDFIAYRFSDDSVGFFLCRKIFKIVCAAWTTRNEIDQEVAALKYQTVIFEES